MNKILIALLALLITVSFFSCIGEIGTRKSVADQYALQHNNSMELIDILEIFMGNKGTEAGADNIHITWLGNWSLSSMGLADYKGHFSGRKGVVHVKMDSLFSGFYMRKREEPVPWSINIYGGRAIYKHCVLKTDTTGGNDFIPVTDYLEKKKMVLESICYDLKGDMPAFNMPDWRKVKLRLRNGKMVYVLVMTLVLNGSTDQALYFNADGSADILLPTDFLDFYDEKKAHKCLF